MAVNNFEEKINILGKEARRAAEKASDLARLEKIRIKYLGRKGELINLIKELPGLSAKLKAHIGRRLNSLRNDLSEIIDKKEHELKDKIIKEALQKEGIDVTMTGQAWPLGRLHPLTQVERKIENIFQSMGFSVVFGPEIENEYYNFNALNIPEDHPARDMKDTFWLKDYTSADPKKNLLLRTETSAIQVRYMEKNNPPLRIIGPGRVYRYEAANASHEFQFHQVEGLMVGKDVSLANLRAVLEEFFKKFFDKKKIELRLRPGYFPFVEPGIEYDIRIGAGSKWLEIVGAGMVHQNVFKSAGYVPGTWQGLAFAFGLERLAMLYYGIDDIRLFHSGDLRFLKQF